MLCIFELERDTLSELLVILFEDWESAFTTSTGEIFLVDKVGPYEHSALSRESPHDGCFGLCHNQDKKTMRVLYKNLQILKCF